MIKVHQQGANVYVIGTDQITEAARHLNPSINAWSGSFAGLYVRRRKQWRVSTAEPPPKDAQPGVCFRGVGMVA